MEKKTLNILIWVTIFSIGMAFLESSVVVYLRALYYPEGFQFPIQKIDYDIGLTEFYREFATLIMLVSIGFIAAKTRLQRFAYFIYSFAIWDIFYYVFLKFLLDWPESLFTWDILFLLPVTWVGPVIAPVLCSLIMIFLALAIIWLQGRYQNVKIKLLEWLMLIIGSIVVIVSFTMDYVSFLHQFYTYGEIFTWQWTERSIELADMYVPMFFNWWVFIIGMLIIVGGVVRFIWRSQKGKIL